MLEELAARPDGSTPKQLAQALGIHLSTTYRLLNTLAAGGYAVRGPDDGLYRLGSRVSYLHSGYLASVRPNLAAIPFAHAMQVATGETTLLTQLEGDTVVATLVLGGSRPNAYPVVPVGTAAPAHSVASGLALLAQYSAAQLDAYIARQQCRPDSLFPRADPRRLRKSLATIRRQGYAIDRGEGYPDIWCIAAAVDCATQSARTAISVLGPASRFRPEEPALVAATLAMVRAIENLQDEDAIGDGLPRSSANESRQSATEDPAVARAIAAIGEAMSRVR